MKDDKTPKPDEFNTHLFPFGKRAGDNKFNCTSCPTCGKKPTHPTPEQYPDRNSQIPAEGFFMFRDELSAQEYYISGMCQACQDLVFKPM